MDQWSQDTMKKLPFYKNPFFYLGATMLGGALAWAYLGDSLLPTTFSLIPPPLGSDGRCTGFPNGLGKWSWAQCCVEHDAGGTDTTLLACIIQAIPLWAAPLATGGVLTMWFCRPLYNLGQRKGWWK